MKKITFRGDLFVGLYLLAAIILFIIPSPSLLLDVLITFNIMVALFILFNCLYASETLDMSSFPTILLFSTVFRIALNISSTKLILTTGDPGVVVKTFGNFVGGGNLVVGAIIFVVLVIVQMIVINKGSERVSEVTARFTLDAMPGKQMAIDADLNTGAITDKEAVERRQKIQEESAFFGSMDGATKYVKGDATAGLIITMINIVGGIITGVTIQGMQLQEALSQYTILTIGDGLVSQIPSMLISIATGVLVTKGAKSNNIGDVMIGQLFRLPKVMYIVGGTLCFLGIFTPLRSEGRILIYLALGLGVIVFGRLIEQSNEVENIEEEVKEEEVQADPQTRECQCTASGRSDRIRVWIWYYSACRCESGW